MTLTPFNARQRHSVAGRLASQLPPGGLSQPNLCHPLGVGTDSRGLRTSEDHKTVTDLLKSHLVGGDCLTTSPVIGHSQVLRNA